MAVTTVAFSDLGTWLDSQPENTVDTPYELNITGLTVNDIGDSYTSGTLGNVITNRSTKYIDLSTTQIPDGVTSMYHCFTNCTSLTKAPVIPDGVTNLVFCFAYCTSLVNAPVIPDGVTNMTYCFGECSSLTEAPVIPDGVIDIDHCFRSCTSLVNAPVIPDGVIEMYYCFGECTSLTHKPIIPSTVTDSGFCYYGVTTNNWKGNQSQVDSFLSTFFAQTVDSDVQVFADDRKSYEYTICNIDISTLSTYLAGLDQNDKYTPYKVYIRGLTTSNASDIKTALYANQTKYVDLTYTTIPQGTSLTSLFYKGLGYSIRSLIKPPVLPTDATSMINTFNDCVNLTDAPTIPSGVTDMTGAFSECTFLNESSVTLPNGVTNLTDTFHGCWFHTSPTIPNSVTTMQRTFVYCIRLTEAPELPSGVTNLNSAFSGCWDLESVPNIPSSVTSASYCFEDCRSLKKIEEFGISASTLDDSDFQNMFTGCTSLEEIGHKVEYSNDWKLVYLDFDATSVKGKVYSRNKTSVSITQTTITKSTLKLPLITDELMFGSISVSDLEDIIEGTNQQEGMLDTNYSWYGKLVIPPTGNNFIMYASDPDKVRTNLKLGDNIKMYSTMSDLEQDLPNLSVGQFVGTEDGMLFNTVDEVTSGVYNSVTSNAVAEKLQNYVEWILHTNTTFSNITQQKKEVRIDLGQEYPNGVIATLTLTIADDYSYWTHLAYYYTTKASENHRYLYVNIWCNQGTCPTATLSVNVFRIPQN